MLTATAPRTAIRDRIIEKLKTRKGPNPEHAEEFVEALQIALRHGRRWLNKGGHGRRCSCDFCSDTRMVVRMLENTTGILEDELEPFGDSLVELATMLANTPAGRELLAK